MPVEYSITTPYEAVSQQSVAPVEKSQQERLFYRMDDKLFGELKSIMGTSPLPGNERELRTQAETQQLINLGTGDKEGDLDPNYFAGQEQAEVPDTLDAPAQTEELIAAEEPVAEKITPETPVEEAEAVEQPEPVEAAVTEETAEPVIEVAPVAVEPVNMEPAEETAIPVPPENIDKPEEKTEAVSPEPDQTATETVSEADSDLSAAESSEPDEELTVEMASQLSDEEINARLAQMPEEKRQDFLQDWTDTEDKVQETVASIQSYQEDKRRQEGSDTSAPVIYELDSEGKLTPSEGETAPVAESRETVEPGKPAQPEETVIEAKDDESSSQLEVIDLTAKEEPAETKTVEVSSEVSGEREEDAASVETTDSVEETIDELPEEEMQRETAEVTGEDLAKNEVNDLVGEAERSSFYAGLEAVTEGEIAEHTQRIETLRTTNEKQKNEVDRVDAVRRYLLLGDELRRQMAARQKLDEEVGLTA